MCYCIDVLGLIIEISWAVAPHFSGLYLQSQLLRVQGWKEGETQGKPSQMSLWTAERHICRRQSLNILQPCITSGTLPVHGGAAMVGKSL